jgi:hypothetical protein
MNTNSSSITNSQTENLSSDIDTDSNYDSLSAPGLDRFLTQLPQSALDNLMSAINIPKPTYNSGRITRRLRKDEDSLRQFTSITETNHIDVPSEYLSRKYSSNMTLDDKVHVFIPLLHVLPDSQILHAQLHTNADRHTLHKHEIIITKYELGYTFDEYGQAISLGKEQLERNHKIENVETINENNENVTQQTGIMTSGKGATKRSVSETKKKFVAAQQGWKCGKCNNQLTAWFEVDHKVRLEYGGSNEVGNLVALCRECHGEKTTRENL